MALEKKNFLGGLNYDTEDRYVPNGDYRYALNCRLSKSDGANQGAVENTKGNTIVNIELPTGVNKVIGSYDNLETNKVYYFLFNNGGNHTIYEFDSITNVITTVLQTPLLNFKSNKFIDDPFMIDDLLFFNDRYNEPGMINVDRAKSNGYPQPLKREHINAYATAPGKPPSVEYDSNSSIKTNNVRNKLFQFRYKYVYRDNQESAWSPVSKVAFPKDEASYRPFLYYPTDLNNVINIEVENSDDYVRYIKIAFREGNDGDFYLAATIDKDKYNTFQSVLSTYTYKFYNDEIYTAIDNDGNEGMRNQDWVPLKSDSQALIDGNRVAYGGITENYDPVDIDIDIEVNSDINEDVDAPQVGTIDATNTWNEYGSSTPLAAPNTGFSDPEWVYVFGSPSNYSKVINGTTFYLAGAREANGRPAPFPTPLKNSVNATDIATPGVLWSVGTYQTNANSFGYYYGNRVVGLKINSASNPVKYATDSSRSIFYVDKPSSAGIRYISKMTTSYYDWGTTNELKTHVQTVQYTSVGGESALDVANALVLAYKNAGTINTGLVDIDFTGSYAYVDASDPADRARVEVWVRGFVPQADIIDITGSWWPVQVGNTMPAIYYTSVGINSYASWTTRSELTLKKGARHGIGMVYYDTPNRSGLTNVSNSKTFYVPFFSEMNMQSGQIPGQTTLRVSVNHTPPSWAKRYQFVYTGNQTIEYLPGEENAYKGFIHARITSLNATTSVASGAQNALLTNIDNYNNTIPEAVELDYSFSKGDRIRFITDNNGDYYQQYADVEVISYDDTTKYIEFKTPDGITVDDGSLVELYTPKKRVEKAVYYEIGEVYDIIGGIHTGNISNQTSSSPAVVDLLDIGDVYLRYRVAPVSRIVESYSYSDFYNSDYWNKGRANIDDVNIKQVKRESTIRYSNPYLPDTNINGLSTFNDFSFEEYDQQYGSIQLMFPEDKDLTIFQRLKVGKVRVGQDTLYSNEGTSVATVKSQNNVLSDIVYYSGEFGIGNNPESFSVRGNTKRFVDVPRGTVLSLGGDGITDIGSIFMHNYFTDTFKELINSGGDYRVIGTHDVRFGEYILSIHGNIEDIEILNDTDIGAPSQSNDSDINDSNYTGSQTAVPDSFSQPRFVDNTGDSDSSESRVAIVDLTPTEEITDYLFETIAFSIDKRRWVSFYSYIPDYISTNNTSLISFKDGQLYKHNDNDTYNNFYGEQFTQKIKFISNEEPRLIKFYSTILTESTHPFSMPEATNQFGQKTSLTSNDFVDDEGVFKSELLMDENTPNVDNPIIEGDNIRCHSLAITLENSDTELVKLFEVGIGLYPSQLTGK